MHPRIPKPDSDRGQLLFASLLALVFAVAFITGGGSRDRGLDDVATQLLCLPLLAWSIVALWTRPLPGLQRLAIVVVVMVVAIPLLQLLPLPASVWQSNAARMALAKDLSEAGVALTNTWSLAPAATERAALSLLPAMSVFLGALAVGQRYRIRLLWMLLALESFSLLLGLVQLGQPQGSLLNPFPQWESAFGGVFANPNHQASALACAAMVALSLLLERKRGDAASHSRRMAQKWALGLCCGVCVLALPLTGSRGGTLLGVLALACVPLAMGLFRVARLRASRRARWGLVAILLGAFCGAWISLRWVEVDMVSETRWSLAQATVALGNAYAPLGTGVGSFVPLFQQEGPVSMLQAAYINHAHNEYAQWWLEAGIPALLVLSAALAVLGRTGWVLLRSPVDARGRGIVVGAWLGTLVLLAHSTIDYPMRTVTLMTTGALLAGLAIAQVDELVSRTRKTRRNEAGAIIASQFRR